MKIHIGTDHAGFEMKEKIVAWLKENGHEVFDHGAHELNTSDDYPDFIEPVAKAIAEDSESRGVIFGGSGQGEAMNANRFPHVRAIVCYALSEEMARLGRKHNDANVISFGARFIREEEAKKAIEIFLSTPFEGGRHVRRIGKLDD